MIVKTQEELDQALADGVEDIIIDSPAGAWLKVSAYGSASVYAYGSASVSAYGSASVSASDSAKVTASDSAKVSAYGSASVSAYGSASVSASDSAKVTASDSAKVSAYGSASVYAYGSAKVTASDSAKVTAYDSASVTAYGSAKVSAYGSAKVTAYDSAKVSAYGSASVYAYGSASVTATSYVAVHLNSANVTVKGGVVIDVTSIDLADPETWAEYRGLDVAAGCATVYKAVSTDLHAGQQHIKTLYAIGSTVTATDWEPTRDCGHGLHFSRSPLEARKYYMGDKEAGVRYLACRVVVADMIPLGDKIKAESCEVMYEVDEHGRRIGGDQA